MSARPVDDSILKRFRAALEAIYGQRIERVVLFGSRARGDAREDSDYDVAVFLDDLTDRWREFDRSQHRPSRRNRQVHPRHALSRRLL